MPTKVNFVLDDDVKTELDRLVKSGMRSRVINNALRRELQRVRRFAANTRLEELRTRTRPMSTSRLVELIRDDRGR